MRVDTFAITGPRRLYWLRRTRSPTDRTKAILANSPMGRFGEPNELIGAAIFLASHQASGFVTGADIRVDGGFLAARL